VPGLCSFEFCCAVELWLEFVACDWFAFRFPLPRCAPVIASGTIRASINNAAMKIFLRCCFIFFSFLVLVFLSKSRGAFKAGQRDRSGLDKQATAHRPFSFQERLMTHEARRAPAADSLALPFAYTRRIEAGTGSKRLLFFPARGHNFREPPFKALVPWAAQLT
jgi:hypothetical protein